MIFWNDISRPTIMLDLPSFRFYYRRCTAKTENPWTYMIHLRIHRWIWERQL